MVEDEVLSFGIDAALAATGWAAVAGTSTENVALVGCGVVETKPKQMLFERVRWIRKRLVEELRAQAYVQGAAYDEMVVVVEQTDYSPGRRGDRARWIREANAREALAFGVTAALLACDDLGIVPVLVGPNEWQNELGACGRAGEMKAQVATLVAYQFPASFVCEFVPVRHGRNGGVRAPSRAVLFANTRKPVPSHVTDAAGMAYVALQRALRRARFASLSS